MTDDWREDWIGPQLIRRFKPPFFVGSSSVGLCLRCPSRGSLFLPSFCYFCLLALASLFLGVGLLASYLRLSLGGRSLAISLDLLLLQLLLLQLLPLLLFELLLLLHLLLLLDHP